MRKLSKAAAVTAVAITSLAAASFTASTAGAQSGDLDCGDPGTSHNMPVPPDDPHDLDDDGDGIGCENPDAFENGGGSPTTQATTGPVPSAPAPQPTPTPPPPADPVVADPNFTG